MNVKDEALRLALEFVEFCWRDVALNDYAEEQRERVEAAIRAALDAPQGESVAQPAGWHNNPRADRMRKALREVAETKSLTATPTQFARALQKIARNALTEDAMDEPATPPQRVPLTEEQIIDAVREVGLDWHQGWTLEDGEPNRYEQLVRVTERAHGIGGSNE